MPNKSGTDDTKLTPQGLEVLKGINEDTNKLREIELGDTPPAAVFHAD
jgi:hypothetical protein